MRYTPVELRHVRIGRAFLGYKRREVDNLLEDVAGSFEHVWGERGELGDKVEELEKALDELRQRESLLASTLVSAEKAAHDAKDAARREAELIISEAHQEARSITRTALGERERLFAEARRIELLLRSALGMVDASKEEASIPAPPSTPAPAADQPPPDMWPNREDTREFAASELLGEPESVAPPSEPEHGHEIDDDGEPQRPVTFDLEAFNAETFEPDDYEPEPEPEHAAAKLPPPLPSVNDDDDDPWHNRDIAWG
jgi:cell division septum initiation protein DivIVA